MIMNHPDPELVCDSCGLPLDSHMYIRWAFQRSTVNLHGPCANRVGGQLRGNVFHMYRLNEYKLLDQKQPVTER